MINKMEIRPIMFKEVRKLLSVGRGIIIKKLRVRYDDISEPEEMYLSIERVPDKYNNWIVDCECVDIESHTKPGKKTSEEFFRILLIRPDDWKLVEEEINKHTKLK